ncbi:hypothetical protein ACVWY2_008940 [Bradyrhizobium sp. JR6.1]
MFQSSDEGRRSQARTDCSYEWASLPRDIEEHAPPARAVIKAIRVKGAVREPTLFIGESLLQSPIAEVGTQRRALRSKGDNQMMSSQNVEAHGSIAMIERIIRKFRELIDKDSSIPPELRRVLHATLDEHLLDAKKRVLL